MTADDVGYLSERVGGAHHGPMAQRGIGYLTRRKKAELISGIDVSAFAAVMVVLLWILAYPFGYTPHSNRPSVEPARVRHAVPMEAANGDRSLVVTVMRDGTIYFGQEKVTVDQFAVKLEDKVDRGRERLVYLNADARTKYGNVKQVLERVRAVGIEHIVFLVENRRES